MSEEKRETTFENAKVGNRCYSNIFGGIAKTNAVIVGIENGKHPLPITIKPDLHTGHYYFSEKGEYIDGGGQCLYWEDPIKEIPTRPKRMVKKTGYIGINPEYPNVGERIALTSNIYCTREAVETHNANIGSNYQIKEIEFEMEE